LTKKHKRVKWQLTRSASRIVRVLELPVGWRARLRAAGPARFKMVTRALCPTTDPACQQHDNQHQENEPAKTAPHQRATDVKTAAAEQQKKDYQQND
jgi:hypothetical protein